MAFSEPEPEPRAVVQVDVPALWRTIRLDLLVRVVPFLALVSAVQLLFHPGWLGVGTGILPVQLSAGSAGCVGGALAGMAIRRRRLLRQSLLSVPSGGALAWETGFYALNAAAEEGIFRGLLQGGLSAALRAAPLGAGGRASSVALGILVGGALYVLYHRLGGWQWRDVAATAALALPLGLLYALLPGPPSLLGVSLAHFGATCGFLGPGTWLMRRWGRL